MITNHGIYAIATRKVMRTLLFFSNALLHPVGTRIQVLTCKFVVDAYKLDLVITFKSLKEFLLSLSKL